MHILEEWRLRDVEQKAGRTYERLFELDSLRSDVDRLEYSSRETRSEVDGLRVELEAAQERIAQLESMIESLIAKDQS